MICELLWGILFPSMTGNIGKFDKVFKHAIMYTIFKNHCKTNGKWIFRTLSIQDFNCSIRINTKCLPLEKKIMVIALKTLSSSNLLVSHRLKKNAKTFVYEGPPMIKWGLVSTQYVFVYLYLIPPNKLLSPQRALGMSDGSKRLNSNSKLLHTNKIHFILSTPVQIKCINTDMAWIC